MAATPIQITVEEFRLFHKIDRALYSLLVKELQRDPFESMQTLALWIWMEKKAPCDAVRKIFSLPNFLICELADEAATCLKCIEDNGFLLSTDASDIPLTQSLVAKEFSLLFIHENRDSATSGIRKILSGVCLRALADIKEEALKRRAEQTLTESSKMPIVSPPAESSLTRRVAQLGLGGDVSPRRTTGQDVPRDDRTMFVTFSKGYPVAEWEIKDFFTRIFGECIECIYMQEVKSHEQQALYARIVFVSSAILDFILNDVPKAKFTINGKHVWMRKFVPKNGNSRPPVQPQN